MSSTAIMKRIEEHRGVIAAHSQEIERLQKELNIAKEIEDFEKLVQKHRDYIVNRTTNFTLDDLRILKKENADLTTTLKGMVHKHPRMKISDFQEAILEMNSLIDGMVLERFYE